MKPSRRTAIRHALAALSVATAFPLLARAEVAQADLPRPTKLWEGFSAPVGMAFDRVGNLHVAEWSAGRITRIAPDAQRTIFASGLPGPAGLAIGPDGAVYVGSYSNDEVYRFAADGRRTVHVTGLATPAGLGFDRSGRLMIANRRTNEILVVTAGDILRPVVDRLNTPVGAVQTADGGYVISNIAGGVTIIRPDGTRLDAGQAFRAPGPGIVQTPAGRIFVVDYGGATVREILMTGTSRVIADGFASPAGLVLTPDGKALLAASWGDGAIWRVALPD